MTRILWNESGHRLYDAGVDHGVLYTKDGSGVVWNGLILVKEVPTADASELQYLDGNPYRNSTKQEGFAATIEAVTYPKEFEEYDGLHDRVANQRRKVFGFSYRTLIGNELDGIDKGYKIHLVYNAIATPSERAYESLSETSEIINFSWDITTTPIPIERSKPSSHLIVDTRFAYSWAVQTFEDILYGSDEGSARLPSPQEVLDIFEGASIIQIRDNGDGTWTAEGPDDVIQYLDETTFQISWQSAVYIDTDTYQISSL